MKNKNYLFNVPQKCDVEYFKEGGRIILKMRNKGIFIRLLRRPKISNIHLDETGSAVWEIIDGKHTVFEIGEEIGEHDFGRLARYFEILRDCNFIRWAD